MELPSTGASFFIMPREDQDRATFSLFRVVQTHPDLSFGPDDLADGICYLYNDHDKYQAILNIYHYIAHNISALVTYHPEDGQPVFDFTQEDDDESGNF